MSNPFAYFSINDYGAWEETSDPTAHALYEHPDPRIAELEAVQAGCHLLAARTNSASISASVLPSCGGWAEGSHYNLLANVRDLLMLAASEKHDKAVIGVCDLAGVALLNIKDRYTEKKRFGATGDELRALELLCDVSEDWWKRQSGGLFIDAEAALHRARQMHLAEASMKEAA